MSMAAGRDPRRAMTHARRVAAWKRRPEDTALAVRARHPDGAALRLDDPPRQREAKTGALMPFAGRGVELMELGEQPRQVIGADTFAGVFDLQAHPRFALGPHPDRDVRAIAAEFDRIRKIVVQHLPQFPGIEYEVAQLRRNLDLDPDILLRGHPAQHAAYF